jgi:hypothetical protein
MASAVPFGTHDSMARSRLELSFLRRSTTQSVGCVGACPLSPITITHYPPALLTRLTKHLLRHPCSSTAKPPARMYSLRRLCVAPPRILELCLDLCSCTEAEFGQLALRGWHDHMHSCFELSSRGCGGSECRRMKLFPLMNEWYMQQ